MQSNTQIRLLKLFFFSICTLIISLSAPAFAKGDVFVNSKGVAIKGYDTVSYFINAKAQKGKAEFSHVHAGNTWLFANAANKKAFIANPVAYLPQYGGHCAYAAGQNSIAPIDPRAWTIRDNKLYLNYSNRIKNKWEPTAATSIVKADAYWTKLALKVEQKDSTADSK